MMCSGQIWSVAVCSFISWFATWMVILSMFCCFTLMFNYVCSINFMKYMSLVKLKDQTAVWFVCNTLCLVELKDQTAVWFVCNTLCLVKLKDQTAVWFICNTLCLVELKDQTAVWFVCNTLCLVELTGQTAVSFVCNTLNMVLCLLNVLMCYLQVRFRFEDYVVNIVVYSCCNKLLSCVCGGQSEAAFTNLWLHRGTLGWVQS